MVYWLYLAIIYSIAAEVSGSALSIQPVVPNTPPFVFARGHIRWRAVARVLISGAISLIQARNRGTCACPVSPHQPAVNCAITPPSPDNPGGSAMFARSQVLHGIKRANTPGAGRYLLL